MRAILLSPKILIVDDVTSFIYREIDSQIQLLLYRGCSGAMIIVIAHRLSIVLGFEQIWITSGGGIMKMKTAREFMEKGEV